MPARSPRSCTRCASPPGDSGPRGVSSATRSGPVGRSVPQRPARVAGRLGAVRDLDVLLEAADHYRADLPILEQRALEPLLADWRDHREDAARRSSSASSIPSGTAAGWTTTATSSGPTGAAVMPVGPVEPHRVRDTAASRDLDRLRAGPRLRAGAALGRRRDPPRPPDRRASGCATRSSSCGRRSARTRRRSSSGSPRSRTTSASCTTPTSSASMARAFLVEHAGEPLVARERRHRPLPRQPRARGRTPAADPRRAVARRRQPRLPPRARPGRSPDALAAPRGPGQTRQPWASSGRRSRQARPACAAARIAPSRIPASDTRRASAP